MSKRKYLSIKEIISSMSEEKRDSLTIWDRYVLRVPSYYVAYIFYNIFHLSANAVSILSALYISMLFLLVYYSPTDYFSYVLFWMNLWALLDCVDGNIARALKLKYHESNPYGDMYDAISGYFVIAGLWITVGYYLSIFYDDIGYLLVGALSSILGIFSRLINILMRLNFHNHNKI